MSYKTLAMQAAQQKIRHTNRLVITLVGLNCKQSLFYYCLIFRSYGACF